MLLVFARRKILSFEKDKTLGKESFSEFSILPIFVRVFGGVITPHLRDPATTPLTTYSFSVDWPFKNGFCWKTQYLLKPPHPFIRKNKNNPVIVCFTNHLARLPE